MTIEEKKDQKIREAKRRYKKGDILYWPHLLSSEWKYVYSPYADYTYRQNSLGEYFCVGNQTLWDNFSGWAPVLSQAEPIITHTTGPGITTPVTSIEGPVTFHGPQFSSEREMQLEHALKVTIDLLEMQLAGDESALARISREIIKKHQELIQSEE